MQNHKNLLVATDFGLSILEESKFRTIETLPALSGLIKFGNRIFSTRDNGEIFIFDKSLTEFAKKNDLTDARFTVAGERLFLIGTGGVFLFVDNNLKRSVMRKQDFNRNLFALTIGQARQSLAEHSGAALDVLAENGKLLTSLETEEFVKSIFTNKREAVSAATTQGFSKSNPTFPHRFDKTKGLPTRRSSTHISDGVIANARVVGFHREKTPRILSAVNRCP